MATNPYYYKTSDIKSGVVFDSCEFAQTPPKEHNGSYYDLPPDCKRLQDVIVAKDMNYTRGNIFKAAYRWDVKGVNDNPRDNLIYNLEKIKWFADDMLRRLYAEDPSNPRGSNYERTD